MPLTTKDAILNKQDADIGKYFIKAWDDEVFIRVMSGTERDEFESDIMSDRKSKKARMSNFRAKLAAICLCDEQGNNIFTTADARDIGKKSSKALTEIMEYAMKHNGITKDDQDELVKNSEETPDDEADSDSV